MIQNPYKPEFINREDPDQSVNILADLGLQWSFLISLKCLLRGGVFGDLFVLRFYSGPVNPMGSCRARSIYLTTRLLGRLSPLSG